MDLFRAGDVAGSIARFDDARDAQPSLDPYLWQRGLSLYYAKRYADGAAQFRRDVAVNPNDTEESIWAFLCEAQMPGLGFDAAQRNFLKVGRDSRAVMRAAYELFAGRATQADLATAGAEGVASQFSPPPRAVQRGQGRRRARARVRPRRRREPARRVEDLPCPRVAVVQRPRANWWGGARV